MVKTISRKEYEKMIERKESELNELKEEVKKKQSILNCLKYELMEFKIK